MFEPHKTISTFEIRYSTLFDLFECNTKNQNVIRIPKRGLVTA